MIDGKFKSSLLNRIWVGLREDKTKSHFEAFALFTILDGRKELDDESFLSDLDILMKE